MLAKLERGEKMSNEAKVGIFTTIGLALLIGIIVYLSGFSFGKEKDYTFDITFNQVTGLKIVLVLVMPVSMLGEYQRLKL